MCFPLNPPSQVWHPSMQENAFVGAVASSTICQVTWKESRLPVSSDRHIDLSLSCGPCSEWPINWLQLLLAMVQEPLKNTVLDNHLQIGAFVEIQVSSGEVPAHYGNQENTSLERIKEQFYFTSVIPPPKVAQLRAKKNLLSPNK